MYSHKYDHISKIHKSRNKTHSQEVDKFQIVKNLFGASMFYVKSFLTFYFQMTKDYLQKMKQRSNAKSKARKIVKITKEKSHEIFL